MSCPPVGSPWGNLKVPGGSCEDMPNDEEDGGVSRWERGRRYGKHPWRLGTPIYLSWTLVSSSVCSWPGLIPHALTPSMMIPFLERPKCLLRSGTTRFSASWVTTQRQWYGKASCGHWRSLQWTWPDIWDLLLASILWKLSVIFGMVASFDVFMQPFISWARRRMRRFLHLSPGWRKLLNGFITWSQGKWQIRRLSSTFGTTYSME